MHDLTPFERRLAERLDVELAHSVRGFDAAEIAALAVGRRTIAERLLNRFALGPLPLSTAARSAALIGAVALLVLAAVVVAALARRDAHGRLAFIRSNGDVVLTAADGSGPAVISHVPVPALFTQLEWAPDGRHLAILDEELRLTILEPDGTVTSQRTVQLGTSRFEWSPDGGLLALYDGPWLPPDGECGPPLVHPHLDVITPDGAVAWSAAIPDDLRYVAGTGELAWSPSGRDLAIVGSTQDCTQNYLPLRLWLVNAQSSSGPMDSDPAGLNGPEPIWLPDGRLAVARTTTVLSTVSPSGVGSDIADLGRTGCGCEFVRTWGLSPDGTRLAFSSGRGLEVLDLAAGTVNRVPVTLDGFGGMMPIRWTPDGTELLTDFAQEFAGPPRVLAIDVETGETRVVLTETRLVAVLD